MLRRYLTISRPKFWLYLLGPYFLGGVLAVDRLGELASWPFWWIFAWFTFPANLLLYGVNDACDYDTDRHNPKKVEGEALVLPEERPRLLLAIALLACLALPGLLATGPRPTVWFALFVALSVAYSAPPLRLKARPVVDSVSNVLYVVPLLVSWSLFERELPPTPLALAGVLWCMAMHAYSAVPDIESDRRAGLSTIATLLGRDGTLALCVLLYGGAALLVGAFDLAGGALLAVYPVVMLAQRLRAPDRVPQWYRFFPVLNGLVGMVLTLRFLVPLAR